MKTGQIGAWVLLGLLPGTVLGGDTASGTALGIELGPCSAASASGWRWDVSDSHQISREEDGTELCLGVASFSAGSQPTLQKCNKTDAGQQWKMAEGTVAVSTSPANGWVSEGGSQQPGARVWLYNVVAKRGYCASHHSCAFAFTSGRFENPAGNCVVTAPTTPTPVPPTPSPHPDPRPGPPPSNLALTCTDGSAEAKLPFCDISLGFEKRAEDLVNRLNTTEQIGYFFSYPGTPYIERFNAKTWSLDATCIHGVASRRAGHVTVFPHAIAQGASWDVDLVRRIGNITAIEARIASAIGYYKSKGTNQGEDLSCDGGPLANTAHDGRCEDPHHVQKIGVTAMKALQGPQPVPGGAPGDVYFATRQADDIGYHGASPDIETERGHGSSNFIASNRSLADSYFPTYGAFQRPEKGHADGIMCAMSQLNGVSSCGNRLLLENQLREEWKSDAIIQTDCCDSVQTMVGAISPRTGEKIVNFTEAFGNAVNAGLGTYYGYWVNPFRAAMVDLLGAGVYGNGEHISAETLKAAAKRMLISHFRLGFYDTHSADFPFRRLLLDNTTWAQLDSTAHRNVAREATSKSTVLLKNQKDLLPLQTPRSVAVIGPFAACWPGRENAGWTADIDKRYLGATAGECYLHSYAGRPSNITSIYGGIAAAGEDVGATVTYALGSNASCLATANGATGEVDCIHDSSSKFYSPAAVNEIAVAVRNAKAADVTVLAVGLGAMHEGEGNDRVNMSLPFVQRTLLEAVAKVSKKLVLVVVSAGGVDVDESLAQAVLWAPYGGEEAGSGLADVIFGSTSPSARLPLTVYKQAWADEMNCKNFSEAGGVARHYVGPICDTSILRLDLEARIGRTHRYVKDTAKFIKHKFGYGLSYTSFVYSDLRVAFESGNLTVSVNLKNTGRMDGAEVVQCYVIPPKLSQMPAGAPLQNLIGFSKVNLVKGSSKVIVVPVDTTQLETAMNDGTRTLLGGSYTISVGGHQPYDVEGNSGTSGQVLRSSFNIPPK